CLALRPPLGVEAAHPGARPRVAARKTGDPGGRPQAIAETCCPWGCVITKGAMENVARPQGIDGSYPGRSHGAVSLMIAKQNAFRSPRDGNAAHPLGGKKADRFFGTAAAGGA